MKCSTILAGLMLLIFALPTLAAEPVHLTIAGVFVAGQSGNSVTLAWDPNSEPDLAGYRVYWGIASRTYTNTPQPTVPVSPTPIYTITGLANGTYYFAVTAFNNAGQESGYSNEVSAVISVPPVPPTGLRIQGPLAFLITGTTVQLAWKTEDPRTSRVEYSYDGGPFRTQPVSQIEVTDHYVRLVDLTPGRIYQYEVVCETPGKDPLRASGTFRTW